MKSFESAMLEKDSDFQSDAYVSKIPSSVADPNSSIRKQETMNENFALPQHKTDTMSISQGTDTRTRRSITLRERM